MSAFILLIIILGCSVAAFLFPLIAHWHKRNFIIWIIIWFALWGILFITMSFSTNYVELGESDRSWPFLFGIFLCCFIVGTLLRFLSLLVCYLRNYLHS